MSDIDDATGAVKDAITALKDGFSDLRQTAFKVVVEDDEYLALLRNIGSCGEDELNEDEKAGFRKDFEGVMKKKIRICKSFFLKSKS